jgi:hypothetical protein
MAGKRSRISCCNRTPERATRDEEEEEKSKDKNEEEEEMMMMMMMMILLRILVFRMCHCIAV